MQLKLPKSKFLRFVLIFTACIFVYKTYAYIVRKAAYEEFIKKRNEGKKLFNERCATAGVKIYKKYENIENVILDHIPPHDAYKNVTNKYWLGAGLPKMPGGDHYIRSFLYWREKISNEKDSISNTKTSMPGYKFIEHIDADGIIKKYSLDLDSEKHNKPLKVIIIDKPSSTFKVSYKGIINEYDRKHWVAESIAEIHDLKNNELIAEARWFSFEPGLGAKGGGRQAWLYANTCPKDIRAEPRITAVRFFVEDVLAPAR